MIIDNLRTVQENIIRTCLRVGRDPREVKILAVSKVVPVEIILKAYEAGQRLLGENKVQELLFKQNFLPEDIEWHLIGNLQRNKVRKIIGKSALIHSVDSLMLAQEISSKSAIVNTITKILLQVNISGEKSKNGFNKKKLREEIKEISLFPGIKIKGLMTMAPLTSEPEETRPVFRELKELADTLESLQLPGIEMKELSMGMSNDYLVAVEEGATIVRIGSRIFGERDYEGGVIR